MTYSEVGVVDTRSILDGEHNGITAQTTFTEVVHLEVERLLSETVVICEVLRRGESISTSGGGNEEGEHTWTELPTKKPLVRAASTLGPWSGSSSGSCSNINSSGSADSIVRPMQIQVRGGCVGFERGGVPAVVAWRPLNAMTLLPRVVLKVWPPEVWGTYLFQSKATSIKGYATHVPSVRRRCEILGVSDHMETIIVEAL